LQHPALSETISTSFELSNSSIDEDVDKEDADSAIVSHQNLDIYIHEPKADDRYVIYGFDSAKAFYDFRLLVKRKIIQDELLQYMWGEGEAKKGGEKERGREGMCFLIGDDGIDIKRRQKMRSSLCSN
jgi:hypothetical protein